MRIWPASLFLIGLAGNLFCQTSAGNSKLRIAIYPFDQSTVQVNIQKEVGSVNYGQVAADLLVSALAGKADVINRDQMKRLLEEQGRRYDEHFDPSQAPEFGKLLGVDAIVTGSIASLNIEEQSSSGLGGALGGLTKKLPKMNQTSKNVSVELTLAAQIIGTATGKILGALQATGNAKKQTQSQTTVNGQSSGGGTTSKSGADAQVRIALSNAVQAIGTQFSVTPEGPRPAQIAPAPKLTTEAPPVTPEYTALPDEVGNVGKLDGETLVFFLAPNVHVVVGEMLNVQHPEFAKNPRTGKTVAMGTSLGSLKVTEVTAETARGRYSGKPVTDQDRVVKKSAASKP